VAAKENLVIVGQVVHVKGTLTYHYCDPNSRMILGRTAAAVAVRKMMTTMAQLMTAMVKN